MKCAGQSESFTLNYCKFGEDRVYVLMLIARKGENEKITKTNEIVIRRVLRKKSDIRRYYPELVSIAKSYEKEGLIFRLYLTADARDCKKAFFNYQSRLITWNKKLEYGDKSIPEKMKKLDSEWMSELQRPTSRADSYFLIDVDTKPIPEIVYENLEGTEILVKRETPNGYHIICKPYNYTTQTWPDNVEVKKNSLLFLERFNDG